MNQNDDNLKMSYVCLEHDVNAEKKWREYLGIEIDESYGGIFRDLWMFKHHTTRVTYCVVKDTGGAG